MWWYVVLCGGWYVVVLTELAMRLLLVLVLVVKLVLQLVCVVVPVMHAVPAVPSCALVVKQAYGP